MRKWMLAILLAIVILPTLAGRTEAATLFLDVNPTDRPYKEISYLVEGEIVFGANGYFSPNAYVTRAEAAAMLGRAFNLNGTKRVTKFPDVGSSSFASGYIQSAVDLGIISGYEDNTFRPNQFVKRGEMALLISRAFNYGGENTVSAAKALMDKGIAKGIEENDFGYELNIKRADFSIFLARAINQKFRVNPSVTFSESFEVNANILNVRTGPSTKYKKIGELKQGTVVQAAYRVGDWIYIRSGSVEGFVSGVYLVGASTPIPPTEPTNPTESDLTDPEQTEPVTTVPTPSGPLSEQVIVIDPGHGGDDPGAVGFGLQEKFAVLETSLELKKLLGQTPFSFKLTRETDKGLTLGERVAIAKNSNADVFLSIHANSFNGTANGTETYYYNSAYTNPYQDDSKLLAGYIQQRMVNAWKLKDRGVKHGNFYVIRENTMPAVLVELGFIDNQTENALLASAFWRKEAAKAIYLGILDYYKAKGFDVSALYSKI